METLDITDPIQPIQQAPQSMGLKEVVYHKHNGSDGSPRIDPKYFLPFPTFQVSDATVAPTDTPQNGTFRFLYDSTHWRIWVRINNLWKSTVLS